MLETLIVGNVGSLTYRRAGETNVLNLSIASSRRVNGTEYTDWIAAKLWGERAEKLRDHIAVGSKLLLRGRPEARVFLRADGTSGGELVLHVNELEFLSPRPKTPPADELPLAAPPEKPKRRKSLRKGQETSLLQSRSVSAEKLTQI